MSLAYVNNLINSCKTVLIAELCDVICYVIAHDLRCQHGNIIGNPTAIPTAISQRHGFVECLCYWLAAVYI